MLSIIKFFHIISGVSFFGITIAGFFYIARSINRNDRSLIDYSIRASYFGDAIILLCIFILMASSIPLIFSGNFTLVVPWIFVAYHAFGLIIIFWILNIFIKKVYLSRMVIASYSLKAFYYLNIAMILIFISLIHDAVMKSTWIEFLFRK
ncbi:MAG: hypothetical protein RJA83_287 [Pseudomonadota bacterium]|jgi:uncharacterized membrane protein